MALVDQLIDTGAAAPAPSADEVAQRRAIERAVTALAAERDAARRRITELEAALERFGDYSRHHEQIRKILGRDPAQPARQRD